MNTATKLTPREEIDPWNVVVTVRPGAYGDVRRLLHDVGQVGDTPFSDVLLLHVENPMTALYTLQLWCRINPAIRTKIDRIVPVSRTFDFSTCEEFEHRATDTLRKWLPSLIGKCLGIRGSRHGALAPRTDEPAANDPSVEDAAGADRPAPIDDAPVEDFAPGEAASDRARTLGTVLQRALRNAGMPEPVDCSDPDLVLDVECVGNWAGLSLWTRGELERYPEIGIDPWQDAAPQSA